ncbi:hypothetical protein PYCC9005_000506 [Savitreella phatthalungensis]
MAESTKPTVDYARAAQQQPTNGAHSQKENVAPARSGSATPSTSSWQGGVQMPARADAPAPASAVQFGNFANAQTPQKPIATQNQNQQAHQQGGARQQQSSSQSQARPSQPQQNPSFGAPSTPQASGGAAPPTLKGKDMPQFGSITPGNALSEQQQQQQQQQSRPQAHSRSNSTASQNVPLGSPSVQFNANQGQGYPGFQGGAGGFNPNAPQGMRNGNGAGGSGRGGMNQYNQPRNQVGQRMTPGGRPSPAGTPQQHHAQMVNMGSPMGSPAAYGYMNMPPQMYGNFGAYPPQMQYPGSFPQGVYFNNAQGGRGAATGPGQYGQSGNMYQNPNFAAAQSMSRSGSASTGTDRPSHAPSSPAASAPAFTPTPRKKGSAAIKIVRPDTLQEVVIAKPAAAASSATATASTTGGASAPPTSASPAPAVIDRAAAASPVKSTASPALVSDSASAPGAPSTPQPETAEQRKAKQEAARQAVLDRIAANKAEEDRKAAAEREAKEKVEREEREAREAEQAKRDEAERVAKEAADQEAAEKKAAEEKAAAEKAAAEKPAVSEDKSLSPLETQPDKTAEETTAEQGLKAETSQTANAAEAAAEADSDGKPPAPKRRATDSEKSSSPSPATLALQNSRPIADLSKIEYPEGTKAPTTVADKAVQAGRVRYDRDFLMQFEKAFGGKPTIDWDERIKDALGDSDGKGKAGAGSRGSASTRGPANPFGSATNLGFNTRPLKSSEERFRQAEAMRNQGIDPKVALGGPTFEIGKNFRPSVGRNDSTPHSPRAESKRGKGGRNMSNKGGNQVGAPTIAPEDVKPLEMSATRWTARKDAANEPVVGADPDLLAPEDVQRKVKGLLNKMTLDNFDRISDQILIIANQSAKETDGRTLRQVIALTFEKATDEAHFSQVYAMFCRKMMECIDQSITDTEVVDKTGQPVSGGILFRKYLLSRCQEDFERGWKSQLPPKPEGEENGEPVSEEAAMLSDEYYIAAAAKRRGLGLVRFVGELFKLNMLNERIMHECIRKLLADVDTPEEEEVESLSKLLTTVGAVLDSNERGSSRMDVYFERLNQMTQAKTLSSRHKFMIMDVLDARQNKWVTKETNKGPKTIAEIHEDAAKQAAAEQRRQASTRGGHGGGGRFDFGHGDVRGAAGSGSRRQDSHRGASQPGPDGWQSVASRDTTRAGDLSRIGMRTQSKQAFGPVSNLGGRTNSNNTRSQNASHGPTSGGAGSGANSGGLSREASHGQPGGNAFAVLEGQSEHPTEEEDAPAQPVSSSSNTNELREPDDDGEPIPEPDTTGRPKLGLLPKGSLASGAAAAAAQKKQQEELREPEDDGEPIPEPDTTGRPKLGLLPKGSARPSTLSKPTGGLSGLERLERAAAEKEAAAKASAAENPIAEESAAAADAADETTKDE